MEFKISFTVATSDYQASDITYNPDGSTYEDHTGADVGFRLRKNEIVREAYREHFSRLYKAKNSHNSDLYAIGINRGYAIEGSKLCSNDEIYHDLLLGPKNDIEATFQASTTSVQNIFRESAESVARFVDDEHAPYLKLIADTIQVQGLENGIVADLLLERPVDGGRIAVDMMLDEHIFTEALKGLELYGVTNERIENYLSLASNSTVKDAMGIAFDSLVLRASARQDATPITAEGDIDDIFSRRHTILNASSQAARQSMKVALDTEVLAAAQDVFKNVDKPDALLTEILSYGSVSQIRDYINRLIGHETKQQESTQQNTSNKSTNDKAKSEQTNDKPYGKGPEPKQAKE